MTEGFSISTNPLPVTHLAPYRKFVPAGCAEVSRVSWADAPSDPCQTCRHLHGPPDAGPCAVCQLERRVIALEERLP